MSGFQGFKFKPQEKKSGNSSVPPPNAKLPAQSAPSTSSAMPKLFGKTFSTKYTTEDDYFEDDEKPTDSGKEYQQLSSESEDELDSFMAGIEKKAKEDLQKVGKKQEESSKKDTKGMRQDIEEEDEQESYFRWLEENPNAGASLNANDDDDDKDAYYDDDGNLIVPEKKKIIDPLPAVDHSQIEYHKFEKNFYQEHEEITKLSREQTNDLRSKLNIKVFGVDAPKPVCSFAHFNFDEKLMYAIRKSEFTQPTPIQSQAIPIALSGRDLIGIAKTGSGKTDAYIWPAIIHVLHQKELEYGDGPSVVILAPTRELVQQIHNEVKKFAKVYNISTTCAYGGGSLYEQTLACQNGVEILVSTPGRLIDLIKKKGTNFLRVTFLVLDEADRMFDMGFEPQVRSIANHCRPDRQTLLFSATFKKRIEKLAREILIDPVKIVQGEVGEACDDVTQIIKIFSEGPQKWKWLTDSLVEFTSTGKVLVFVTQKVNAIELAKNIQESGFNAALLHGDMHQDDRNVTINNFKKSDLPILVATDVAARGLDISAIKTVVNYDVARDIDTHVHRIGRTGRAGEKGTAYTLVTPKDKEFLPHLVKNLETTNQTVPDSLLNLALEVPWFKSQRQRGGGGGGSGGNKGRVAERPGLGLAPRQDPSKRNPRIEASKPTISSAESTISGPKGDRMAVLKQAYKNQFQSNFVSSTSSPTTSKPTLPPPKSEAKRDSSNDERDEKSKKSRWG